MNNSEQRVTCAQVRAWDIVNYLSALGYIPTKKKGYDYWYLSPLRKERTASFKINRKLNRWYDHGLGKGGNIIDFAIQFHNCTVAELLKNIAGKFSFHEPSSYPCQSLQEKNKIEVLNDFIISSSSLLDYLNQRHIPFQIADQYCKEIRYKFKGKIYYAVGFKNEAGGYELRNKYFKNSSAPKSITTIKNGCEKIAVFEGFFDFLYYLALQQNKSLLQWDFCILNSLSFFEKSRPYLEEYNSVHLFLDNDTAGQNCSHAALRSGKKYIDESGLYKDYKDLNDFLIGSEKKIKSHNDNIPP